MWEMAGNRCAVKLPKERKLYGNVCNGSWEKPSNSGLIQKVAGVHQASSRMVRSLGSFGYFVLSSHDATDLPC